MQHGALAKALCPKNTNICLASGTGDLEVTFDVLDRVKSQRLAPKPLSFINTVSNATCYYLTQQFALDAASTFVSKQCFALESAFAQARLDAHAFGQASTLIGAVDALTTPMKTHAMRLGVPASAALAEGSHWFRMGARDSSQSAIGWLEDVSYHRNAQAAIKALEHLPGTGRVWSAKGFWLDNDNYTAINTAINGSPYKRERTSLGFYETSIGQVLVDFLSREDIGSDRLISIQSDHAGRICTLIVRRA